MPSAFGRLEFEAFYQAFASLPIETTAEGTEKIDRFTARYARKEGVPGKRSVGRRGGDAETRPAILEAALELFARQGYDMTSIRSIATLADVDPGLIRHFFGSKERLFVTAVADRTKIPPILAGVFLGPPEGLGERLVRTYLGLWEAEETGPVLRTLIRSAMTSEDIAELLVEIVFGNIKGVVEQGHGEKARIERAVRVAPELLGVAIARYLLRVQPLADMTMEEMVAEYGPVVQRQLQDAPAEGH